MVEQLFQIRGVSVLALDTRAYLRAARRTPDVAARDAAGKLQGFDVDIAKALCAKAKFDCEIVAQAVDLLIRRPSLFRLPDYGVGAVILTNADSGVYIRGPLMRRLLEVLFDGKPEAEAALTSFRLLADAAATVEGTFRINRVSGAPIDVAGVSSVGSPVASVPGAGFSFFTAAATWSAALTCRRSLTCNARQYSRPMQRELFRHAIRAANASSPGVCR